MKLTLIRHGITEGNKRSLYYGASDLPLLPEGMEALRELAKTNAYPTAPHYYTSDLIRTQQTLHELYGDVPFEILTGIREINFGDFEMHTYEELKDTEAFQLWCEGNVEANVCPNGESANQLLARALKALQQLIAKDEDTVCITHGGVIAAVMGEWFPQTGNRYERTPHPGTGVQIIFEDQKPVSYRSIP